MRPSRSELFLMEIMIDLLFLCLSGTLCVQLFVRARRTETENTDITNAILWSETLAEAFYAEGGANEIQLYFDKDWSVKDNVPPEEAAYAAVVSFREDASYQYADIRVIKAGQKPPIYKLTLRKYKQAVRSE